MAATLRTSSAGLWPTSWPISCSTTNFRVRQAIAALGKSIAPVLDGDRLPTDAERLSAVLRGVTLGVYSRLWLRGPLGLARDTHVVAREDAADELALELLAPKREVVARASRVVGGRRQRRRGRNAAFDVWAA